MGGLGSAAATPPTLGSEEAALLLRPDQAQADTDGQPVSTPPHGGLRAGRHPPPTPAEGFQQQAAPRWLQRPGLCPSPPQRGTPPHPAAPPTCRGSRGAPKCSPLTPPEYTATSPLTAATPPNTQPQLLHKHTTSPHSNTFLISAAACTLSPNTAPPHAYPPHIVTTLVLKTQIFMTPSISPNTPTHTHTHTHTHTASITSSNINSPL